jgi:hypothetical protein
MFLIEDFLHLPPVSTTPVVQLELRISPRIFEKIRNGPNGIIRCTLSCEYLREFSKKFETPALNGIIRGFGELIFVENLKSKISWHCPFKYVFHIRTVCNVGFSLHHAVINISSQEGKILWNKIGHGLVKHTNVLLALLRQQQYFSRFVFMIYFSCSISVILMNIIPSACYVFQFRLNVTCFFKSCNEDEVFYLYCCPRKKTNFRFLSE